MIGSRSLTLIGLGAIFALSAFGNLVVSVPGGTGAWYSWASADGITDGDDSFWDNASKDGTGCNVGFWLASNDWDTLGGSCSNDVFQAGDSGPGKLDFFGNTSSANSPVGWQFQATGPNADQYVTLRLEVAGWKSSNEFGWVDKNGVLHTLFSGATNPQAQATISVAAGDAFGFYICPNGDCSAGNIMFSNTDYAGGANDRAGKFALFSEAPQHPSAGSEIETYWIGVEDTLGNDPVEGWGDFNDILISATIVPEPGFYGLMGLGLAGIYWSVSRRRKKA